MSMTLQASDLALYAIALLILFLTPGPVWVALLARAISGGFQAAWPLALGGSPWRCDMADPRYFRRKLGG